MSGFKAGRYFHQSMFRVSQWMHRRSVLLCRTVAARDSPPTFRSVSWTQIDLNEPFRRTKHITQQTPKSPDRLVYSFMKLTHTNAPLLQFKHSANRCVQQSFCAHQVSEQINQCLSVHEQHTSVQGCMHICSVICSFLESSSNRPFFNFLCCSEHFS